ncbi:MAG: hypothetical protein HBSAPP02_29830 [Phycisphaerae bacterium]|nr:MAG: STAS domain-containing protein [Planctomycetia bacterium]GJQ27951.1 MAG: hypothetical protein HBSAPP02_29830 [Phycisphaerae bacterium]
MSGLQCQVRRHDKGFVARLKGTFGSVETDTLDKELVPALGAAPGRIILDLSGLEMLGSAGVGAMLKLRRKVDEAGGKLVLADAPENIMKILEFSELHRVFTTALTVDSAMHD